MPNTGIVASGVNLASCTDVLQEPFDNLSAWSGSSGSIVAGRNGTALQLPGSQTYTYTIPAISESNYITVGMAYQLASLSANRNPIQLRSDAGGTNHITVRVASDGSLKILAGGITGGTLGTTVAGIIIAATWAYIELQVFLHDTLGSVVLRVNNTVVLNLSGVDTNNSGTKTTFDSLSLIGTTAVVEQFDDLYISTGVGCSFQGDHVVPSSSAEALLEPFNNFSAWTVVGTPAIVAGRTGTCGQFNGAVDRVTYNIPAPLQSDTITVGFAFRRVDSSTVGPRAICEFFSDNDTLIHNRLRWTVTTTLLEFNLGPSTVLASNNAITFVTNTWYYIEIQVKLHDTIGFVIVKINGTTVLSATNVDTKAGGTKTVYDAFRVGAGGSTTNHNWDDLYITMGAGATFKGSITVP